MAVNKRLERIWKFLYPVAHPFIAHKFHYQHEKHILPGPSLIISNHVTNWDPLLLALSFPKNHMHFVASEHMFRWGVLSKFITWLVEPIARRKGASGTETAMACLRKIRDGHSVCIFGEGEVTWDGRSQPAFPGTGMLAKACGGHLITYRIEGGCLSAPRWAKKYRKGKMSGAIVKIYTPEMLKTMSTDDVAQIINEDIYLDAFKQQDKSPVRYRGKKLAENLENALFLCPKCHQIGTLKSKGNFFSCECGLHLEYSDYAAFSPETPFRNIQQWDDWQHECLKNGDFIHGDDCLFSDKGAILYQIQENKKVLLENGIDIALASDGIFRCGKKIFSFADISNLAMVQADKLFFTIGNDYYQLQAEKNQINFRKYLAAWKVYKFPDADASLFVR